ncbi:MAG: hypothetical protein Q9201_007044 [Fulgogasparrea decipioides]
MLSGVAGPPSKSPGVDAGPPRQALPQIIAPGVMIVSTQSGKAAVVTVAPVPKSVHSGLSTDARTFTISTTLASPTSASTQFQSSSSSATPVPAAPHKSSAPKLAAVIVVPLVLLAILSPIIIVWYISWRRKRRSAKRRSERLSGQSPLIDRYHGTPRASRHRNERASSNPAPRRPKKPNRIVSVPTPTFSSFNCELSRPASVGPIRSSNERRVRRPIPKNRHSATFSWGAPPPYTAPTRTASSSSPAPRLDTPDFTGSPLIETAQMVHIRPVSGQPHGWRRSNNHLQIHSADARSNTFLAQWQQQQQQPSPDASSMLQVPDPGRSRQGSGDSTAESLHHRSTLQRPFSFQALASPALTDISGLSFDPTLWASTTYGRDSIISPLDDQHETEQTRPHQIV